MSLHEAFERSFLPLLRALGFESAKAKKVKPGNTVALARRVIDAERRLEVTVWSGPGRPLAFRFDRVEPINGVECTVEIPLLSPWPDPTTPKPAPLSLAVSALRPEESPERLTVGVEFLAGAFAAVAPEAEALRQTELFVNAVARAKSHWDGRHQRGAIEERSVTGTIVFTGAQLLMVEADGVRLTFRFDTSELDRAQPLSVSRWFKSPAGTPGALRLVSGRKTFDFDERGQRVP